MNKLVKIVPLLTFLFMYAYSFAQLTKGSLDLNCNMGYTTTGSNASVNSLPTSYASYNTPIPNSTTPSLITGVDASYFISDNLTIGISFSYSISSTPITEEGANNEYYLWNYITKTINPGIFAIKYFPIANKLYFAFDFHGYLIFGNTFNAYLYENSSTPVSYTIVPYPVEPTTGFNFSIAPGLVYGPSHNWYIAASLNGILGYRYSEMKDLVRSLGNTTESFVTENMKTSSFAIGAGLTPTLGISYIFGKQQQDKTSTN